MNKYTVSEANQHKMKLVQMGADVHMVNGKMVYVNFKLNSDIEISYSYNINHHNKYFLERITPYPLSIKEFDCADDVVEVIKIDHLQYLNAIKSHNIDRFISVNKDLHKTIKSFEDLYLYYNIPCEYIIKIQEHIGEINAIVTEVKEHADRVFFDKEPENL